MPVFKPVYTTIGDHAEVRHRLEKQVATKDGWIKRVLLLMSDGCVLYRHAGPASAFYGGQKRVRGGWRRYEVKKMVWINDTPHTKRTKTWDERYLEEKKKEGYEEKERGEVKK